MQAMLGRTQYAFQLQLAAGSDIINNFYDYYKVEDKIYDIIYYKIDQMQYSESILCNLSSSYVK